MTQKALYVRASTKKNMITRHYLISVAMGTMWQTISVKPPTASIKAKPLGDKANILKK